MDNITEAATINADAQRITLLRVVESQVDALANLLDNSPMLDQPLAERLRDVRNIARSMQNDYAKSIGATCTAHHALGNVAERHDAEVRELQRFQRDVGRAVGTAALGN